MRASALRQTIFFWPNLDNENRFVVAERPLATLIRLKGALAS